MRTTVEDVGVVAVANVATYALLGAIVSPRDFDHIRFISIIRFILIRVILVTNQTKGVVDDNVYSL